MTADWESACDPVPEVKRRTLSAEQAARLRKKIAHTKARLKFHPRLEHSEGVLLSDFDDMGA